MKKNILIISAIVVILAVGGGAFYAGMIFGKSQKTRMALSGGNFLGSGGVRQGQNTPGGAGLISGSIIAKDDTSITLQLPNNNGSKIVFYSETSQINKFTNGTADDLLVGTPVSVTGTTNSDGSVTAKIIQIRPANQAGK
jgi:hypothetical protein